MLMYLNKKIVATEHFELVKYIGYSAHESNLVPFMVAIGLTSAECQFKKLLELQAMSPEEIEEYNEKSRSKTGVWGSKLEGERIEDGICVQNPPYASNLIFELNHDDEEDLYYVKVLYNGYIVRTRQICGKDMTKDGFCRIENFSKHFKKHLTYTETTI